MTFGLGLPSHKRAPLSLPSGVHGACQEIAMITIYSQQQVSLEIIEAEHVFVDNIVRIIYGRAGPNVDLEYGGGSTPPSAGSRHKPRYDAIMLRLHAD